MESYGIECGSPVVCCQRDCNKPAAVGAHVEYVRGPVRALLHASIGFRSKWYIVPTCSAHNNWQKMNGRTMECKDVYAMRVRATRNERIAAALLGRDQRNRISK
jgi:hypothetical protein